MSRARIRMFAVVSVLLIVGCGDQGNRQKSNVTVTVNDAPMGPRIEGNGKAAVVTRDIADFHKIRTDGSLDITVRPANRAKVSIAGDSNVLPAIVTHSQDGLLTISEHGDIQSRTPVRIDVAAPSVEHITQDGAGAIHLAGIRASRLGIDLNGSGAVDGNGAVDALSLDLSGSGNFDLAPLRAKQVDVSIGGSGNAEVTAIKSISASVSGSGSIVFSGNPPVVTKSVTGSGTITAK